MLALLMGLAGKALEWMLGRLFGSKEPTPVDLADSNARAQTQLTQQETANAVLSEAARARTDADARVLHESQQPSAAPGAHTALDADGEGHWRD